MNSGLSFFVHPSSFIDENCFIGNGTIIWHFCHIMRGSIIGENCSLGQNVVVGPNVTLGNNVKVQNNVSVFEGVACEDDVFLGPSVVFTNVLNPRSAISRKHQYLPTVVRRGATIGANATILCGIEIGQYAFIGAGSVVTRSVPDFALVTGNPARQKGWMSTHGQKLEFDESGKALCRDSGQQYIREGNQVRKME